MAIRIFSTGIRDREWIISPNEAKQSAGTLMQVHLPPGIIYPPSKSGVANLSDLQIRDSLNQYSFFQGKTPIERKNWLDSNSTPNADLYLEDVPGLAVKFSRISGKFMLETLTSEQINTLLAGNPNDPEGWWPIVQVYSMFPRKPGSRARRTTLVFRPNNWNLKPDTETITNYTGLYLIHESSDLLNGTLTANEMANKIFSIITPPASLKSYAPNMGILAEKNTESLTFEKLELLMAKLGCNLDQVREIKELVSWFPPSLHKSLIQKLIRTRCTEVIPPDLLLTSLKFKTYSAKEVLLTSFSLLLLSPGSFVPNIQRFVTGLEAACKRLAVSISEDSYFPDGKYITTLFTGAWLAQNNRDWIPSLQSVTIWMQVAAIALESPQIYHYDWHATLGRINSWTPGYINYYLLASLKSFESDILMMCSIADFNLTPREYVDPRDPTTPRLMELIHCIDQHSFTDIAHYFPGKLLEEIGSFSELFKLIWNQVVGINPRSPKYSQQLDWLNPNLSNSGSKFFKEVRRAQSLVWLTRANVPKILITKTELTFPFEYKLPLSWIAAFVGPIEFTIRAIGNSPIASVMAVIRPDDLFSYTIIRRPSREKDVPELTDAQQESGKIFFRQKLIAGIPLIHVPGTLKGKIGKTLYLKVDEVTQEESYWVQFENGELWSVADSCILRYNLPIINHQFSLDQNGFPDYLREACLIQSEGIHQNSTALFEQLLASLPVAAWRRSLEYLIGFPKEIDLYHISRDGSGVELSVSINDTWVNLLLSGICCLYPAALIKDGNKYLVKNGPLLWFLSTYLEKKVAQLSQISGTQVAQIPGTQLSQISGTQEIDSVWSEPLPEKRNLWEHQVESINRLYQQKVAGKRVKIIWIPVGLGKTSIVLNYIRRLIMEKKMPKYCLYALPPSAKETIIKEITLLGIPYQFLDMTQASKTAKNLLPGTISLIYHDHLRLADFEELRKLAPEMMFILDEMHKALNMTIRTSLALELAHLAADVIGMTGTLIKSEHVVEIIPWLKQVVDFEVTPQNYLVAMGGIISRKIGTRVVVERIVQECEMTPEEKAVYTEIVPPNLGGKAVNIDFREAVRISNEAITRGIIEYTLFHVRQNLGVFVVAKNIEHQQYLANAFRSAGVQDIFLLGKQSIALTPEMGPQLGPGIILPNTGIPQIVITTKNHSEGYTLTKMIIMVTGVYFSNNATREQLDGRINRLDQTSPTIRIIVLHAGIISYIHEHYEKARNLSAALKGFAKSVNLEEISLSDL